MTTTYPVSFNVDYPDRALDRLTSALCIIFPIPHYIVLFFLGIGAIVAIIIAWFAILFTGKYPRGLFDFVVGVLRWSNRVTGYAFVLVTDEYPPFTLA